MLSSSSSVYNITSTFPRQHVKVHDKIMKARTQNYENMPYLVKSKNARIRVGLLFRVNVSPDRVRHSAA